MAFLPPARTVSIDRTALPERFAQALLDQNQEATFTVRLGSEDEAKQVARSLVGLGVFVDVSADGVTLVVRRS